MTFNETLQRFRDWCVQTKLPIKRVEKTALFSIQVSEDKCETYLLVRHKDGYIIDENMKFMLDNDEMSQLTDADNIIFLFGDRFYYTPKESDRIHFYLLNRKGKARLQKYDNNVPALGIHTKYEYLNGSKEIKEWVAHAKYLGINTLSVCERNSISATLAFQLACKKNGIKPIIGSSVSVSDKDSMMSVKLYVIDDDGWRNLLSINAQISIYNNGSVEKDFLLSHSKGLVFVFNPTDTPYNDVLVNEIKNNFDNVFYQFDTKVFVDEVQNEFYLESLQGYMNSNLEPILINDAYYINQFDRRSKQLMNAVANRKTEFETEHAYFKDVNDNYALAETMFLGENSGLNSFMYKCIKNAKKVGEICVYEVNTGRKYLPNYEMTKDESEKYKTTNDLFFGLIMEGLKKIEHLPNYQEYLQKARYEAKILVKYGFVDYFLIVRDFLVNKCRKEGVLTGIGRGSVGGSIIAYLLNISYTDPVKYDLLFSRFLNEGRLEKKVTAKKVNIHTDNGDIELWDTDLLYVSRDGRKQTIMAIDLKEDEEFEIAKQG